MFVGQRATPGDRYYAPYTLDGSLRVGCDHTVPQEPVMGFYEVLEQALARLKRHGRLS